jgi:hypothetical protein
MLPFKMENLQFTEENALQVDGAYTGSQIWLCAEIHREQHSNR